MDVLWIRRTNRKLKDKLERYRGTRAWSYYVPDKITDAMVNELCPRYFVELGVEGRSFKYGYSIRNLRHPHDINIMDSHGKVEMNLAIRGYIIGRRFGYRLLRINYFAIDRKPDPLLRFIRDTYWVGFELEEQQ